MSTFTKTIIPWMGSNNFDSEEMLFSPITSNQLLQIISEGTYRSNSGSPTITIDLLLNSSWTTVYSDEIFSTNPPRRLDEISVPISFEQGIVTGIRFQNSLPLGTDNFAFQDFRDGSGTQIEFSTIAQVVNEPSSLVGYFVLIVLGITIFLKNQLI